MKFEYVFCYSTDSFIGFQLLWQVVKNIQTTIKNFNLIRSSKICERQPLKSLK